MMSAATGPSSAAHGAGSGCKFVPARLRVAAFAFAMAILAFGIFAPRAAAQEPQFIRGDANANGNVSLIDPVFILYYIFLDGEEPSCLDTADVNDTGSIELLDAIYALNYLFNNGGTGNEQIPVPFPACGIDGSPDAISCIQYEPCGTEPPPPPAPVLDPHPLLVNTGTITITGTTVEGTTIEVIAPSATLTVTAPGGVFTAEDIPLTANAVTQIFFRAIDDEYGTIGPSATTSITNDITPPDVFIDFPPADAELVAETSDVAGRVSDTLSGYLGLTVTVNGIPAEVNIGIGTNGTFFLPAVQLVVADPPEPTVIEAVATDLLGNSASVSISVTHVPSTGTDMEIVSGNGQTAERLAVLPEPLVVHVENTDGTAVENKLVTFEVIRSNGLLTLDGLGVGEPILSVFTNADGDASVIWQLGTDAGSGNNRIEVTSSGISGSVFFCASATPGAASQINVASGHNQTVEAGAPTPFPLEAWVNDSCNGVEGVEVTFTVISGGGLVNGDSSATATTSPTGHAQVNYATGLDGGLQIVEANFLGNAGQPATFLTRAIVRDTTQPTTFRGCVLDNARQPLEGAEVTLTVSGVDSPMVISAADGSFFITGLDNSGPAHLHVNGQTVTHIGGAKKRTVPEGSFPELAYNTVVIPNATNSLGTPVLLPRLDARNNVLFDNTKDVTLTVFGIDGFSMLVKAGSMTLADGTVPTPEDPTFIGLHQVHHDDIPMPMPDGAAPLFAWTFQPGGASFNPPVSITYPNMSGLPPGGIAYFLSFDHDTNQFEIVASGFVTDDAVSIVSDAGAGISKSGWGCNCPPYSVTGDCENCDVSITNGPMEACPDDECTYTAVGDPSGGDFSWSGGTAVGPTDQPTYTCKFPAKGDQTVTVTYTCPVSPPASDTDTFTTSVKRPHKDITMTRSAHPSIAAPVDIQALFIAGAVDMYADNDGPGAADTLDDVCLDVLFVIPAAADATFPDQTFLIIFGIDYTLAQYNNPSNASQMSDLLNADFARVLQVTTMICAGVSAFGCAATGKNMVFNQNVLGCVTVHELGHAAGLPHRNDPGAIMHATALGVNEINTSERSNYEGYTP